MADRLLLIPEVIDPAHRKGRHVRHDPASLRYLVPRTKTTPKSVRYQRRIPLLNQQVPISLGSCTCSSATGVLGTDPFWHTLPADLQRTLSDSTSAQLWAIDLYREVTRIDPFPGQYEPDDTGSAGLYVAKVLKARGLISGYTHITSVDAAHAAIQRRPWFMGGTWFEGMENPSREGIVKPTGKPLGGHQWQVEGYDAERDLWECPQTWGPRWGDRGYFRFDSETLDYLLSQQGDATQFTPLDLPAPAPAPAEPSSELDDLPVAELDTWAAARRPWWPKRDRTAADAWRSWRERHRH